MYFPYLRGKQNEVLALRELAPLLAQSRHVTPILEPVRKGRGDNGLRQIAQIAASIPLIVIDNPERGDFDSDSRPIRQLLSASPQSTPGLIVNSRTTAAQVSAFFSRYPNRMLMMCHFGSVPDPEAIARLQEKSGVVAYNVFLEGRSSRRYIEGFDQGASVLLADPFERRAKNVDYPPHEFFSDLHKRYEEEGFAGFGDFLIVGNHYAEGGGAAHAVAIHLTNREGAGDIWIRHFVSDRTRGTADTPGKFLEALKKTARFIRSAENWYRTEGCQEFLDLEKRQHFPGLGFVKKISMKHHIELMQRLLEV
jgi:hypothetical protein